MRQLTAALLVLAAMGCNGAAPSTATPPDMPSPTPAAAASTPTASPTAAAATQSVPPTTQASPTAVVLPDEPWIVYEWSVGDSVGNRLIRPDGTGDHWATPDAPIATGPQQGNGWQLHPDWSPDGEQLVYVVDTWPDTNGQRDIWISNADGSETRQLFDCAAPCDTAEFPAWSKDGRSVMFVTWNLVDEVVDGSQLRLIDVESGSVTTLAETEGDEYFAYPRWSADGERVVVQLEQWSDSTIESTFDASSIAVVDLTESPPTIETLTAPDAWSTYPDWHPTEDLIVYTAGSGSAVDNGSSDLYTMRSDGSEQTLVLSLWLQSIQPTWLPDGSGVIFTQVQPGNISTAVMRTINADGTDLAWAAGDRPHPGTHPRLRP